jgi:hypothetical protein
MIVITELNLDPRNDRHRERRQASKHLADC